MSWVVRALVGGASFQGCVPERFSLRPLSSAQWGGHLRALKAGVWQHCLWLEHRGTRHSMHKRNPEDFPRGGRVRLA